MKYSIDAHRLDYLVKILSGQTLACPPPFDFSKNEIYDDPKDCPAKNIDNEDPCSECWKRWLLGEY